jgi:apolipoprotein N-acyltransferase
MAFAVSYQRTMEGILAMLASAAMYYFGNGLEPWWPLMWFFPLPLLLFALRSRWWTAALTTVAAMMLGSLNLWGYLVTKLGLPVSAWVEIFLVASIAFAAGVLLFRALVLRGAVWSGLLVLPALWVTCEYVRNLATPHGTAGSFAYSQLRFLPFLQFASVTGPWGMSFVLLLFPAAIAIALHLRQSAPKRALQVAGVGIGVVALMLVFGLVRLAAPNQKQMVKVGLITSDEKPNLTVAEPGADTERLFRDYAREGSRLGSEGAQAIVMPEKVGVTLQGKAAGTYAILQSLASQTGATVVAGGACGRTGEIQRGPHLYPGLRRAALRQGAHATALRVQPDRRHDASLVGEVAAKVGCGDLQGHGLLSTFPSLRQGWCRAHAGAGVGFRR